jgi:hypothetical protein
MLMLFNRSIQEMVFPDQWKIAHVIALFKKGDKSCPKLYVGPVFPIPYVLGIFYDHWFEVRGSCSY